MLKCNTTILSSVKCPVFNLFFFNAQRTQLAQVILHARYCVGCIRRTSKYQLQPPIIVHWFINSYINFNTNFQQMAICLVKSQNAKHMTLVSLWCNLKCQYLSTANLTFSHVEKTPTLEKYTHDLTLQLDNVRGSYRKSCELGTADEGECGGRWNQLVCYP